MTRFSFTLLCCVALTANAAAEDIEPVPVAFEVLGAEGTVHQIQIRGDGEEGYTILSAGHDGSEGRIEAGGRWFQEPLLTYHSREVGQIVILHYREGGGTGVSSSGYIAFCCTERGCQRLYESLAERLSVSIATPQSNYILVSDFRPVSEGFEQAVRLDRPVQVDSEDKGFLHYDSYGPVRLRFRVERDNEGLVTIREIDRNSAHALLDIVELGLPTPQEWAVSVLEEQWPGLKEPLCDYLESPRCEQVKQMQVLHARLDDILPDGAHIQCALPRAQ
jgi:hypothetical protein